MWERDDEVRPLERLSTLASWVALCLAAVVAVVAIYRAWPR